MYLALSLGQDLDMDLGFFYFVLFSLPELEVTLQILVVLFSVKDFFLNPNCWSFMVLDLSVFIMIFAILLHQLRFTLLRTSLIFF